MNPPIKIYCGKMNVYHVGPGIMRTSEVQEPPAHWQTTGPEGEPLSGPITFPETYVNEKTPIEWWVRECQAIGNDGRPYPEVQIVSNLPPERCDFVLFCYGCGKQHTQDNVPAECSRYHILYPHVIARAILAPTMIQVPWYVGEVWQPGLQCTIFNDPLRRTNIIPNGHTCAQFAGQQGIVYPDCAGYFTGLGQVTMEPIVATGEVRWSKV